MFLAHKTLLYTVYRGSIDKEWIKDTGIVYSHPIFIFSKFSKRLFF